MKALQKSGEDYLEAIYNILKKEDHAHSVNIAKMLNVSKPSTFKALQILAEKGYIEKENYGAVTLTKKGKEHAETVIKKHQAIRMLLIDILKVSQETAESDACKIEHCLSEETTEKLFSFLNFK